MTIDPSPSFDRPFKPKVRAPGGKTYHRLRTMLGELRLTTVCQEALCPNIEECWNSGTATFMLMGDTCTRACRFCAVKTGNPKERPDPDEPVKVGRAIAQMKLDYVVLTSVDRDDLPDLGSSHFAETVKTIKAGNPRMIVEALTPDFNAVLPFIKKLIDANVDVFAHNIETVERLTPKVRDRRSGYKQSLATLEGAKKLRATQYTKSSIMLGLGETEDEILKSLQDLRGVGCDVVTFGQYLAPTKRHKKFLPVLEYVPQERFDGLKQKALEMGFLYVASGPLVRSSYKAGEFFMKGVIEKKRKNEKAGS
ncbi:MAG: lipoyl synthase [Bacteriovoracales bacterium]|nr:lipoyl synthase [Bacteriovoracales bacterium]